MTGTGKRVGRGHGAPHQLHHRPLPDRRIEMHIEDLRRAGGGILNGRDFQRRTVRREYGVRRTTPIQLCEHLAFEVETFGYIFDDQIRLPHPVVQMRRVMDAAEDGLLLTRSDMLLGKPLFQFLSLALSGALQRRLRATQEPHRIAIHRTLQGNLGAHGASTYDGDRFKGSYCHVVEDLSLLQNDTEPSMGIGVGSRCYAAPDASEDPLGTSTILPVTPPCPSNSCACRASARGKRC